MNTKQKLLDVLREQLEEVSEQSLAQLMLDLYEQKVQEIEKLRQENARDREQLQHDRELIQAEIRKMRSDPLYCAPGEYYFVLGSGKLIHVLVQGYKMRVLEELTSPGMWSEARSISREEASR